MSNGQKTVNHVSPGLRRFAAFAVLAVAWLQLAAVAHSFEHAAAGTVDLCDVCVQFDRNGNAPPAQPPLPGAPVAAVATAAPTSADDHGAAPRPVVRQRAPPAV